MRAHVGGVRNAKDFETVLEAWVDTYPGTVSSVTRSNNQATIVRAPSAVVGELEIQHADRTGAASGNRQPRIGRPAGRENDPVEGGLSAHWTLLDLMAPALHLATSSTV